MAASLITALFGKNAFACGSFTILSTAASRSTIRGFSSTFSYFGKQIGKKQLTLSEQSGPRDSNLSKVGPTVLLGFLSTSFRNSAKNVKHTFSGARGGPVADNSFFVVICHQVRTPSAITPGRAIPERVRNKTQKPSTLRALAVA